MNSGTSDPLLFRYFKHGAIYVNVPSSFQSLREFESDRARLIDDFVSFLSELFRKIEESFASFLNRG